MFHRGKQRSRFNRYYQYFKIATMSMIKRTEVPKTKLPTSLVPQGGGPPSRGSSADAEDRTPPPHLPHSPFIPPPDTKLFTPTNTYNFPLELSQHPSLTGKQTYLATFTAVEPRKGYVFSCLCVCLFLRMFAVASKLLVRF